MDPQNPPGSSHGGQQQEREQPVYDISNGGHYGASAALSARGYAPVPELYTGTWANVNQGLHGNYRDILTTYWQQTINQLENETHDYKIHQLPLARIKKVMKADPEVKMISAEAPILFAKGCDIFITELTMRAWIHAEENKRRTLQRSDIASALAKSDMFDFLIDIVPREEATSHSKRPGGQAGAAGAAGQPAPGAPVVTGQLPSQQTAVTQPSHGAPQHHMAPPDYTSLGQHALPTEQDYRAQAGMYAGAVQSDPTGAYGQPPQQMFEGMYGYAPMPPQQMYQVGQRGPDPSTGTDAGHHYSRHDGGDGDADAEGEGDYEVG
ncbi:histone-fold-containing protein [Xylona heveae TC161]|uniref:Histone-fold-containing protein n=1 Tax=Xylona heveae (strain CBS 132557 / TC161) TaxID=1328760 RepID=A0A165FNX2_XYLHT|nr:histone-fold-containing protein [Xylona heveae TC161]KZF21205.1 histone-fold-containing protein [Xylona heveae TC161]